MAIELITKEDFNRFKQELFTELKNILQPSPSIAAKRWLKSYEVMKMLKISQGTLQNLRIKGTLHPQKIGGTLYFDFEEIEQLLKK